MRLQKLWVMVLGAALLAGCAHSAANKMELAEATAATQQARSWPTEFKCSFTATINFAGNKINAVGMLDFHNAQDFRMTAATSEGKLLFDARYNWAGIHNLHASKEIPDSPVGTICRDVFLALREPEIHGPLKIKGGDATATWMDPFLRRCIYFLKPDSNELLKTSVQLGTFDTLTIHYRKYDSRGWPVEIVFDRPYRFYSTMLVLNYGQGAAQ